MRFKTFYLLNLPILFLIFQFSNQHDESILKLRIVEDWGKLRQFAYLNFLGYYKRFNCNIKIKNSKGKEQVIEGMKKKLTLIGPNFNDFLFDFSGYKFEENDIQIIIELKKNPFIKKVLGNGNKMLKKQV